MAPAPLTSADPARQLEDFRTAVDLLGGQRELARRLGVNETTARDLYQGRRALHAGFLADVARLLVEQADAARELEKRLNPLFAGNLTPEQRADLREGKQDARRHNGGRLKGGL